MYMNIRKMSENHQHLCGDAALAHQNDFDVCWARGSVSELLFAPLVSPICYLAHSAGLQGGASFGHFGSSSQQQSPPIYPDLRNAVYIEIRLASATCQGSIECSMTSLMIGTSACIAQRILFPWLFWGLVCQVEHIERAGGNIVGGRLVSDLQLNQATGSVSGVVSRDREGNETIHEADAVVFAIGITGDSLALSHTLVISGCASGKGVFRGSFPVSTPILLQGACLHTPTSLVQSLWNSPNLPYMHEHRLVSASLVL